MYSKSGQSGNISIILLWLLFVCLSELSWWTCEAEVTEPSDHRDFPDGSEPFPHLLHLTDSTKRVHIVSEIVHNGVRIQVEEYLDLDKFSQLIQFKWHEAPARVDDKVAGLRTVKLNSLLLNSDEQSVLYHYEPYRCAVTNLNENNSTRTLANRAGTGSQSDRQSALTIPFLTNLKLAGDKSAKSRWVSGVAGLWMKALLAPENASSGGSRLNRLNGLWRLELGDGQVADFYIERVSKVKRGTTRPIFEAPTLIELRDRDNRVSRSINLFNIEFNYDDQLADNLFRLPVGFNCPSNVLHESTSKGVYFRTSRSQLMELELVATGLNQHNSSQHQIDVRNIELARSRHPIDSTSSISMYHSLLDGKRIVHDNGYKLEYKIYKLGMAHMCEIQHLHFTDEPQASGENDNARTNHLSSTNPIRLELNNNILVDLSEFNLDFVLGLRDSDNRQMRLLNVFEVSKRKSELVYEADVPEEHNQLLRIMGNTINYKLRIVRVFEQDVIYSNANNRTKIKRGIVEFSRAIIFVLSKDLDEKVAELRINLVQSSQIMSFAKRAKLFDLSRCRDMEKESLQLVVHYPLEPDVLQSISDHSHEIINSFYLSSFNWLINNPNLTPESDTNEASSLRKRRLGASLNYLRVPKVELKLSPVGELEMHLTILEKSSPLDLFEHLTNSYFQGDDQHDQQALVSSLRECADQCLQFDCKVFAYMSGRQCRLSRLPLLSNQAGSITNNQSDNQIGSAENPGPKFARLVASPRGDVYYEPQFIGEKQIGEASLAEIYSYIEHISIELDEFMLREAPPNDASSGDSSSSSSSLGSFTMRHKRATEPLGQPLFVFDYLDRSQMRSDYDTPSQRLLVPSELSFKQVPPTLDVRALAQANRVGHTFKEKLIGKVYKLTALDAIPSAKNRYAATQTTIREPDRRVFRDQHNKLYYILHQVASISQKNCALLCYNLDEINWRTASEQVCISFSYSRLEEVCVLLIRTDFSFVSSLLDLVQEGDIVHDLNSTDQLLVTNFDGIVTIRQYLANFDGPLPVGEQLAAYRATDPILESDPKKVDQLDLEWLQALVVEGNKVEDSQGEECAEVCSQRNRKQGGGTCLAFDYCYTRHLAETVPAAAKQVVGNTRRLVCNLLLVNNKAKQLRSKARVSQIRWLQNHLRQATGQADEPKQIDEPIQPPATTCLRYLVSHLRDFNHLNKRKLTSASKQVAKKLERFSETLSDTDQGSCAMECASYRPADCLVFEFCQEVNQAHEVEQRCSLFKRTNARNSDISSSAAAEDFGSDSVKQLTSYHDGCHVFLRREYETLEQALNDKALDRLDQQREVVGFEHGLLTVCFACAYLSLIVFALAFVYVRRRKMPPGAPAASFSNPAQTTRRPIVSIMMNEMSAQRGEPPGH